MMLLVGRSATGQSPLDKCRCMADVGLEDGLQLMLLCMIEEITAFAYVFIFVENDRKAHTQN